MKFSLKKSDILQLYGRVLYSMPDTREPIPKEEPELEPTHEEPPTLEPEAQTTVEEIPTDMPPIESYILPPTPEDNIEQTPIEESLPVEEERDTVPPLEERVEKEPIHETPKALPLHIDDTPPLPSPEYFISGKKITWKMKSKAKLAFVLTDFEFGNRVLTRFLKKCIDVVGLDAKIIGFGVMNGQSQQWDFSDMPVEHALVFDQLIDDIPNPYPYVGKQIYQTFTLTEIQADGLKAVALGQILQQILSKL